MTVKELLDLYSNWNIPIVINDDNLQPIRREKNISDFYYNGGLLLKINVVSFSVIDGELAIRVDLRMSEIEQIIYTMRECKK